MTAWANSDFEAAAAKLAATFLAGDGNAGASLDELVTKTAREASLNPEQVTRLCRSTNVLAFEQKFATLAGDRDVRFALADPGAVLNRLFDDASTKTASVAAARYPELPDMWRRDADIELEMATTKLACEHAKLAAALPDGPNTETRWLNAKAAAARHTDEARRCDTAWDVALRAAAPAKLAALDAFEKAALAHLGESVVPELNLIREHLGVPAWDLDGEKLAALVDRLEVPATAATRLLKTAVEARLACLDHAARAHAAEAEATTAYAALLEVARG